MLGGDEYGAGEGSVARRQENVLAVRDDLEEEKKVPSKGLKEVSWRGSLDAAVPVVCSLAAVAVSFVSTTCEALVGPTHKTRKMAHRSRKTCEPLGPVYLLRSVRDQIALFQERRGITAEENNFVNLLAVMISQAGQAMYAVFTMFLALLPLATMFLHIVHFVLDRMLDLVTTRKRSDLIIKGTIFTMQAILIFFSVKFILQAIFMPIFNMQSAIISKMFLFDDGGMGPMSRAVVIPGSEKPNSFQFYICKPPVGKLVVPPPTVSEQISKVKQFFVMMSALPAFFVKLLM